jgi:predicted acetyltransferase
MEFDTGENFRSLLSGKSREANVRAPSLVTGNAGDHKLIHAMLRVADRAPNYEEFLAWLEEPTYEPTDRLLVKREGQILAHVQLLARAAWFQGVKLPVGGVAGLATLPECREAGYEGLLLTAAEQALRDAQAVVALANTDQADVFRDRGWCEMGHSCHTEANVNEVLARLAAPTEVAPLARRVKPLGIRLWRQVELDALANVYRQAAAETWGAIDRSEAYWRWLVGRKAHDELIVAIHGRDDWDLLESPAHIVGYAMRRGSHVLELATLPGFRRAAAPLLARACQDAIERDYRTISLHTPVDDPLHHLLTAAGGSWLSGGRHGGSTWMVKLLDPARWIEGVYEVLLARAKAAGLARPMTIAFAVGRRKYRLELTRRSGHFTRDDIAKADVGCTPELLGALLLGSLDVHAARDLGQIDVDSDETVNCLAALFCSVPFWQSPLDTLRA